MKKLALAITMALTFSFISCNEDVNELNEASADLRLATPEVKTNIGTYKGVFTTTDSEYRGIVEIEIADANASSLIKSLHKATVTLQDGSIVYATSNTLINADQLVNEALFSSNDITFNFSVNGDGSNPVISNVVLFNKESDIILAKHTDRAPVTPIDGTFTCDTCNGYPGFNGSETFNMVLTNDGSGDETITTQVNFGGTTYSSGIGVQGNVNVSGSFSRGDIESGDGTTNQGFIVNGSPVIWYGNHTFDNVGATDCSRINGIWYINTASWGVISGEFISDSDCTNTPVELLTENFGTFTGAGFSPTPTAGQLDSNVFIVDGLQGGTLIYGGTQISSRFAQGTSSGGIGTGGIYAFDVSTSGTPDWALGVQPSTDNFLPGYFEMKTTNTTANILTSFTVSYTGHVFNDQTRSNSITVSYSTNGIDYTEIPSLYFASPELPNPTPVTWVGNGRTADFFTLVQPMGDLYIRFTGADVSGGGSRDEFAINNLSITEKD